MGVHKRAVPLNIVFLRLSGKLSKKETSRNPVRCFSRHSSQLRGIAAAMVGGGGG